MTAKLQVRLSQYLLGPSATEGVVATLYPLESETKSAGRRTFVIPAGAVQPKTIEVAPGRYIVEALLPSGETVSEEIEVADGGEKAVDLQGTSSEHEWLSWQRLVGNVGRGASHAEAPEAPPSRPFPGPPQASNGARGGGGGGGRVAAPAPPPIPRQRRVTTARPRGMPKARWIAEPANLLRGDRNSGDAWSLLGDALGVTARTALKKLAPRGAKRVDPGDGDADHQLYRLSGDGPAPSSQPIPDRGGPLPRRYLFVEGTEWTELVCAPVPWLNQSTGEQSVVEVLVRTRPASGEAAAATTLRDPTLGAALSYMTIGALPEARQIYDQAKAMLWGKLVNPLAAAGGGYILLATEPTGESDDWPNWIENLRNRFPWLPDGSIQAGWLKLKRRRDTADVEQARDCFHEAVARGLPFYSMGLQRLVEGLTMFSADPATDQLLQQVRAVAGHANLQQPFTTLRLRG